MTVTVPHRFQLNGAAYRRGYSDAWHGRSDFVRRSLSHANGDRGAYMAGRVAGSADRCKSRHNSPATNGGTTNETD